MGQETPPLGRYSLVAESDLDPRLKGLLRYWEGKRGGRAYPARPDIDPLELKPVLGNIALIDVVRQEDAGLRFRYRLFGTEFVFYHGTDLTGHWLDEIPNADFRDALIAMYTTVVNDGQLRMVSYDYMLESRRHRFQALILPLSSNDQAIDIILACGVPVAVF
ncbi:MAG TPA: PAS domain-containing protein [Ferrovibrio sp.]|uniref:PAS domain-containing protein n=1 Tax=Ferrovibrio sp. TaxID=1917215 RepID=UPI002ED4BB94